MSISKADNWLMEGWASIPIEKRLRFIEAIQLDAFKAGAEWAAQFCEDQTFAAGGKRDLNEISYDTACIDCQKLIQEEASNLKEIPK